MVNFKLISTRMPILLLSTMLTACSNLPGAQPGGMDFSVSLAGTRPGLAREFETVDLVGLLDPERKLEMKGKDGRELALGEQYDKALNHFQSVLDSPAQLRMRRNLVQNRIMAASDLRCGRFIQHLRSQGSDTNFGLGVATTVFAAAAAVVPGVSGAKNLAAMGAISSGSRAEYNTEYFSNLSINLIVRSIQDSRTGLREQIVQKQNELNYTRYDVAAAVSEAIRYDAACNIINGLEHANEAVQRLQEPGREAVGRALLKDKLNQAINSGDPTEIDKYKEMVAKVQGINTTVASNILRTAPNYVAEPASVYISESETSNPFVYLLDVETQTLAALQAAKNFMMDRLARVDVSTDTPDPQQDTRDTLKKSINDTFDAAFFTRTFKQCLDTAKALEIKRLDASYALQKSTLQPSDDRAANIKTQHDLQSADLDVVQFNDFLNDFPLQLRAQHDTLVKDFADESLTKIKLDVFKNKWDDIASRFKNRFPKVDAQCPQQKS